MPCDWVLSNLYNTSLYSIREFASTVIQRRILPIRKQFQLENVIVKQCST